jgi:uroporphyrinogen decarboxylase
VELFNRVKNCQRRLVAPIVSYPILKETNKTVCEVLNDSETQMACIELTSQIIKTDFIYSFMDLSVEAEALGAKIKYDAYSSPQVIHHPVKSEIDLDSFHDIDPYSQGRMPVFIKTQELMKKKLKVHVGSYIASPFTLAGLLMGAENLSVNTIMKPDFCIKVIEYCTHIVAKYAKALEKAGADSIVILDPTAVLISPKAYKEFILPFNREIVRSLQVPVILHTCGNSTNIIDSMIESEAQAISLDAAVNIKKIASVVPKDVIIMGNIDPVKVFLQMDAKGVYSESIKLLEEMKEVENFVLSSGCDLPYNTPIDNIVAFCNATQNY